MTRKLFLALGGAAVLAGAAAIGNALAGPEKVEFPANYKSSWVRIATIDRYDQKAIRTVYMHPEAWQAAAAGQPLPDGTYLALELRPAKLGADGLPIKDANGRFLAEDKVNGLFVQQKKKGWGAEYPDNIRNGEWEFAVFNADGTRHQANANVTGCMNCHKPRVADDYTFVASHIVNALKTKDGKAK
jgi:hypothetical protein